jgi:hypothetical protein
MDASVQNLIERLNTAGLARTAQHTIDVVIEVPK